MPASNQERTAARRSPYRREEITVPPVRDISGQVIICLLGGAGNSHHMSTNNDNVLSSVIRREQRSALRYRSLIVWNSTVKERSFTTYKNRSWFEPSKMQLSQCHELFCHGITSCAGDRIICSYVANNCELLGMTDRWFFPNSPDLIAGIRYAGQIRINIGKT